MEVVVLPADEAARLLADAVEALVRRRPDAVLGVATGSSPMLAYRQLVERRRSGRAPSYARVRAFLLDEYVGLPADHEQSYLATIRRELTDHLDLAPENVHVPNGSADDLAAAGPAYDAAISAAGGVDLQVLGIGTDGHLAFNEPGSSLASRTRLKTLTARTRQDNARFFGSPEDVPRHVLTQGLGTILEARHLVLVASGEGKAAAVAAAVEGPVTASCPGSVLQMHPHVTVLVDEEAGAGLARRDYYVETYNGKPAWQGF
jgi:glucosamine-6-phosphate deaminase